MAHNPNMRELLMIAESYTQNLVEEFATEPTPYHGPFSDAPVDDPFRDEEPAIPLEITALTDAPGLYMKKGDTLYVEPTNNHGEVYSEENGLTYDWDYISGHAERGMVSVNPVESEKPSVEVPFEEAADPDDTDWDAHWAREDGDEERADDLEWDAEFARMDAEPECSYCDDEEPLDGFPCLNCGSLQYVDEEWEGNYTGKTKASVEKEKRTGKCMQCGVKLPKHTDDCLIGRGLAKPLSIKEAATRKDFRLVANLISKIEDPVVRVSSAEDHATMFALQNPRFDKDKFMAACNASDLGVDELSEDEYDDDYEEDDWEAERYDKKNAEVEKFKGRKILVTDIYDGDVYGYLGHKRFMISSPLWRDGMGPGHVSDSEIEISDPDFSLSDKEEAFLRAWHSSIVNESGKPYATMKDGPDKYLFRKDNKQKLVGSADNEPEEGEVELEENRFQYEVDGYGYEEEEDWPFDNDEPIKKWHYMTTPDGERITLDHSPYQTMDKDEFAQHVANHRGIKEMTMDKEIREMQIAAGIVVEEDENCEQCADCKCDPCECEKEAVEEGELPDALKQHQFGKKDDDKEEVDEESCDEEVDEEVDEDADIKEMQIAAGIIVAEDCDQSEDAEKNDDGDCSPFTHADENVAMVREDGTWPGPYEDTENWIGQSVLISGGEYEGAKGRVIDASAQRDETGGRQAEFVVRLVGGRTVTLYPGEWSDDQLDLSAVEVDEDNLAKALGRPDVPRPDLSGMEYETCPECGVEGGHTEGCGELAKLYQEDLTKEDMLLAPPGDVGPGLDDVEENDPWVGHDTADFANSVGDIDDRIEPELDRQTDFNAPPRDDGDDSYDMNEEPNDDERIIDVGDDEDYEEYDFDSEFEAQLGGNSRFEGMYEMNELRRLAGLEPLAEKDVVDGTNVADGEDEEVEVDEEVDEAIAAGPPIASDEIVAYEIADEKAYYVMADLLGAELDFGPQDEILVPKARQDEVEHELDMQGFAQGRDFAVAGQMFDDLQNGYDDRAFTKGSDYFPGGATSSPSVELGPAGAKQGDNPMRTAMTSVDKEDEIYESMKLSYRRHRRA